MNYEAWRISYQDPEQAARAAWQFWKNAETTAAGWLKRFRLEKPTFRVLGEIDEERQRQDKKWGGETHDDHHTTAEFVQLIEDYAGWARTMAGMNSHDKARNRLVQVAALAVAAVEAIDRKRNPASHDYPACAIFRGGKCSCDADDVPNTLT